MLRDFHPTVLLQFRDVIGDSVNAIGYDMIADTLPDFYMRNYSNLQGIVDAIEAQTGGVGYLKENKNQKTFTQSTTVDIEGQSIILDGLSRSGTKIKYTGSDELFTTSASHLHTDFRNMWMQGTTAALSDTSIKAVYQSNLGAGADLFFDAVRIDSFGTAIGGFDATNVVVRNSFLQYNHTAINVGWQGDQWTFYNTKLYDNNIGIDIGGSTAGNNQGAVTSIADIYGRNKRDVVIRNESAVFNQFAAYSEDTDSLLSIGTAAGGAGSVGIYANIIGGYYQNPKDAGFEIHRTGGVTMIGNLVSGTGLDDNYVVDLNSATPSFVAFNNNFSGGYDTLRISGNHLQSLNNRFVTAYTRHRHWFDANTLGSDDPIIGIKTINAANKTLWKLSRHNGGDAAQQYEYSIKDISNSIFPYVSQGGFQYGENGALPTASASYKGAQMHYADKFWICVDDGAGGYEWQEISTVSAADTVWHSFDSNSWYKHNAAGYSDVTDTTWTDGYDRSGVYFPDAALSAMQLYFTPEKVIATSAVIFMDIYWRAASATTGNVVWGVQYGTQTAGAAGGFSGASTTTTTTDATATDITITRVPVTVTSQIDTKDMLIIRPRRAGTDGSDTMTDKAIVQYIRIGYL